MKNDHTHLKRLAAISLVLVMCLSALPMLAPSASAAPAAGEGRGYVCITFDDGNRNVYENAYPVLKAAGITATFYVTTDWIGGVGGDVEPFQAVTAADLLELQANGWEIGSHGTNHTNMRYDLTLEQAIQQMADSKAALEAIGIDCDTMAYPYGSNTQELQMAAWAYYERQRLTTGDYLYLTDYPSSRFAIGSICPQSLAEAQAAIDKAILTDSVVVLLYHYCAEDGTLYGSPNNNHKIQDIVDYIVEKRASDGLKVVNLRDIPNSAPAVDTFVWDGEGADELASTKENWYKRSADGTVTNNIAPTAGSNVLWFDGATKNCTWDLSITVHSTTIALLYTNTITVSYSLDIGRGGHLQYNGILTMEDNVWVNCSGDFAVRHQGLVPGSKLSLWMQGDGTVLDAGPDIRTAIRISGATCMQRSQSISSVGSLIIDAGAELTLATNAKLTLYAYQTFAGYINNGIISGPGTLVFLGYNGDKSIDPGVVRSNLDFVLSASASTNRKFTLQSDLTGVGTVRVLSDKAGHTMTLDLNGHNIIARGVVVGSGGVLLGGSSIISLNSWDSNAGTWTPGTSVVIISNGGSVVLASSQSFNRLELVSDDGRTANVSITAAGVQELIVTGLKPGSYLWYLDGEEQGEIRADKDGTIALSYTSTGLHSLEVKPTQMTEAMDGVYQAVGIVAMLAVLGGLITMVGRLKF